MEIKIQYMNLADRECVLSENSEKFLVEEQNLFEGNFLIFADAPRPVEPVYIDMSKEEAEAMKTRIADLEMAVASILGGGV